MHTSKQFQFIIIKRLHSYAYPVHAGLFQYPEFPQINSSGVHLNRCFIVFCKIKSCKDLHKAKGFCKAHYNSYYRKVIDIHGNIIRYVADYGITECKIPNCDEPHQGKGFCQKHYQQHLHKIIDKDGNKLRETRIYGQIGCKIPGCDQEHASRGFCQRHYARLRLGIYDKDGNKLRKLKFRYLTKGESKMTEIRTVQVWDNVTEFDVQCNELLKKGFELKHFNSQTNDISEMVLHAVFCKNGEVNND